MRAPSLSRDHRAVKTRTGPETGTTPASADVSALGPGVVMSAFLALVFIGGSNFVAVRFTTFGLDPLWGAGSRFLLAAVLLVVIGAVIRAPFPTGRAFAGASLYGLLAFGVFYALTYLALVDAPSAVAAVVLAVVPLVTLLLALVQRQERFRWRGLIGGLVALGGMGFMVGTPDVPLASFLMLAGAALAAGEAGVIAKWFPRAHPVTMNAVAMAVGSTLLLLWSWWRGESWSLPVDAATWAVQVYLITIGSVGLFVLYLFVLKRWTATRAAFAFVLFPVVAAALGWWLLDDPITLSLALGSLIVLAGVYIGAMHGALSGQPADESKLSRQR